MKSKGEFGREERRSSTHTCPLGDVGSHHVLARHRHVVGHSEAAVDRAEPATAQLGAQLVLALEAGVVMSYNGKNQSSKASRKQHKGAAQPARPS